MRYRGFGKSPKKCNLQNHNNPERSKSRRDAWERRHADPELYTNGKKFKEMLKKEAKHERMRNRR